MASSPSHLSPSPDLTPAPAFLRALADVGEIDLVRGLGQRRLAEAVRPAGSRPPPRRTSRRRLAWLLLAAATALLLLALG